MRQSCSKAGRAAAAEVSPAAATTLQRVVANALPFAPEPEFEFSVHTKALQAHVAPSYQPKSG